MTTLRQYQEFPPLSDLDPGFDAGWRFDVLILQAEPVERTKGGIILTDSTKDDEKAASVEALVVEVGPTAFRHSDWVATGAEGPPYVRGDICLVKRYPAGVRFIGRDGREYMMVADEELRGRKLPPKSASVKAAA